MDSDRFEIWKADPTTAHTIKEIEDRIRDLEEHLGYGRTISGDSYAATAINTSLVVGEIAGLRKVLIEYLEEGEGEQ